MNKYLFGVIIFVLVVICGIYFNQPQSFVQDSVKIGVITDLTGPAAYWGESTRAGAQIAAEELNANGHNVSLVFEDYQLEAAHAASAAQKLLAIDDVDALYVEFNPGAISAASVLADKNTLFIFDAAITSPLADIPTAFKTYLDYQEGCKQIAQRFRDDGVEKIGVLEVNLEFGQLCVNGVREVYGSNVISEGYNLGTTDFRTQLLKINNAGVGAVINVGFEGDTLNTLKIIKEFGYEIRYGTVGDTVTPQVLAEYGETLKGGYSFGFPEVSKVFAEKLAQKGDFSSPYGAALAYTHIMQIANAVAECDDNSACQIDQIQESKADDTIGFRGFIDRIADLRMVIADY